MKAVVLGGTRGIGRAIARRLAEDGTPLVLLGRDEASLSRARDDLLARGAPSVATSRCDLLEADTIGPALDAADAALDGFDTVIVTAGLFGRQDDLEDDVERTEALLTVNLVRTVRFCEEARRRLMARGGGTLCVLSSVSGDRPRRGTVLYGCSKAGLDFYLDGLDLRHRGDGLAVVHVKPGFIRTDMTAGLPEPPFAADAERVADDVAGALARGRRLVYTPGVWRLVMSAVRAVPRFVLRRTDF